MSGVGNQGEPALRPSRSTTDGPNAPPTRSGLRRVQFSLRAVLAVVTGVAVLAFAVYANSLANGLHVDDQQQIVDNVWIKDVANLGEIFTSGVWDHAGRVSSYYRPMMYVLYMAVYLAFGINSVAFHFLNVALHVGSSILVVLITWTIMNRSGSRVSPFLSSLVAGLLFAAHPIHTEAVAWAAGRPIDVD